MAASISSSFDVTLDETISAGETATITLPSRTLQVTGAVVTGDGDAEVALNKVASGGAVTKIGDATLSAAPLAGAVAANIDLTNSDLVTTDNLQVVVTGGNVTKVIFHCIGNPSQSLTTTVV